jgi:lipopolysaccharide biosynthesis glycosyltransferase
MNLIYICVFHNESYINLLELLINSIYLKSNIDPTTTHILLITSPSFQPIIKNSLEKFNLPIYYYILNLHGLFEAGCARLKIFKYENIDKYDKILYLDTDILLNSDVNTLFNINISDDKLYTLEEGRISVGNYYGSKFFDFSKINRHLPAFTTGILFFKNSNIIKNLFKTIELHITDYVYIKKNSPPTHLDQPFIVYNAITQQKYDNQLMKQFFENNPKIVTKEKIIYHFPGHPGSYNSKIAKMMDFWSKIDSTEFIPSRLSQEINNTKILEGKTYSWVNRSITFLKNGQMNAFGKGNYKQIEPYTFQANFGNRKHILKFNNDHTEFISTRMDDNKIETGKLL